jgi:hypothetical protein
MTTNRSDVLPISENAHKIASIIDDRLKTVDWIATKKDEKELAGDPNSRWASNKAYIRLVFPDAPEVSMSDAMDVNALFRSAGWMAAAISNREEGVVVKLYP